MREGDGVARLHPPAPAPTRSGGQSIPGAGGSTTPAGGAGGSSIRSGGAGGSTTPAGGAGGSTTPAGGAGGRSMLRPYGIMIVAIFVGLVFTLARAGALRVEVGVWGDHTYLDGVYPIEVDGDTNLRWSTPDLVIHLPRLVAGPQVLTLDASGYRPEPVLPPTVRVTVDGQSWGTFVATAPTRRYALLLPPGSGIERRVGLMIDGYTPPDDPRTLGLRLDRIALARMSARVAVPQLVGQSLFTALLTLLPWASGLRGHAAGVLGTLAALLPVGMNLIQPLWVGQALDVWLLVAGGLVVVAGVGGAGAARRGAAVGPRPAGGQSIRRVLRHPDECFGPALTAALAVRLLGATHPLFDTRDLPVHTGWLAKVIGGQLYLYSTPGELENRLVFNPPSAYLLLAPLRLLLDERLVVQIGTALLDWLALPLLLLIARELRLPARVALLAVALYAALPINLTMLWWGFAANNIAQVAWLLLLWLVLRLARAPRGWQIAGVAAASWLALTTHIGALVLVAPTLAVLLLGGAWALPRRSWLALLGATGGAALLSVPVYFSAAAAPVLAQGGGGSLDIVAAIARNTGTLPTRLELVPLAFLRGFLAPVLALTLLGLPALWRRAQHPLRHWLFGGWLAVSIGFLGVYLSVGYLTRYVYFLTPLVCLAAAWPISRLWVRPGGRVVVIALVLFVAGAGIALWAGGVLLRIRPSLVPLTH